MRAHAAGLTLACLVAGCAMTPQQTLDEGMKSVHRTAGAPAVAAGCIARNMENESGMTARVRALDASGAQEVIVGMPGNPFGNAMFIVHLVSGETSGSTATIYTAMGIRREFWVGVMLKGC